MAKKMLFVFNPKAGKGRIKMHLLDIVDIFSSHDYEVIIRATQAPKDAYEKAKEYFTEKYPKEKIKSIKIYINTNEKAAYYVINEKADEDFKIEL